MSLLLKPRTAHLVGDDPFGRQNLVRMVALTEGGGTVARDAVTLREYSLSGGQPWTLGPYGAQLTLVSASAQYIDAGAWDELSGATAFTLIMLCRRTATSNQVIINRGAGVNTAIALALTASNLAFLRIGTGAADAFGSIAHSDANWHFVALVYDGSQATNATRARLFIDGIEQTLSFTGTIPATAPTTSSSVRIGSNEINGTHSDGSIAGVWLYTRALGGGALIPRHADPWSMIRVPEFRRLLLGSSLLRAYEVPPAITATFSEHSPVEGARNQSYLTPISVRVTPTNVLNPIDDVWFVVHGRTYTATQTAVGGGAVRATADVIARAGETITVEVFATTQDTNENTDSWTYDTRREIVYDEIADYYARRLPAFPALTDYVLRPAAQFPLLTDHYARSKGVLMATEGLVDYAPQANSSGILNSQAEMVEVLVVEEFRLPLLPIGLTIGEWSQTTTPIAADILGTDFVGFPLGLNITATEPHSLVPVGLNITRTEEATLLPIGADVRSWAQTIIPIALSAAPSLARLALLIVVASTALQEVEEEP